jgi:hypothetical protein
MAPRKKKEAKDGHVITLNGKEYITHIGLLDLAHKAAPQLSWSTDPIHEWSDPSKDKYAVKARVWDGEGREFTGIGDANPQNLNGMIRAAAPRMAETRALNRALRALVNHGATTADEMPQVGLGSEVVDFPVKGSMVPKVVHDRSISRTVTESERLDARAMWFRRASKTAEPYSPVWASGSVHFDRIKKLRGSPSFMELEAMCDVMSRGKVEARNLEVDRLAAMLDRVETEDGQELLSRLRERVREKQMETQTKTTDGGEK